VARGVHRFTQPTPDPAAFGLPAEDDGSRDDPLLSDRSSAVSGYRLDIDALAAAPTRVVLERREPNPALSFLRHSSHSPVSRQVNVERLDTMYPSLCAATK